MDREYVEFLQALGARIKQLRAERGWTLRQMVLLHLYHESQWRKYERGGGLTLQSLLRIATLFKMPMAKLLDGIGDQHAETSSEPAVKPRKTPKK